MIRLLLLLVLFYGLWIALLWFGIMPDFVHWPLIKTVLVHVLPPLLVWLIFVLWSRYRKARAKKIAEEKKIQADTQHQAELVAAKEAAEKMLHERQFFCECRFVALSDLVVTQPLIIDEHPQISLDQLSAEEFNAKDKQENSLDDLGLAIAGGLRSIYLRCASATALPIYLAAPSELGLDVAHKRVQMIYQDLVEELALTFVGAPSQATVRFLPSGRYAVDAAIDLFTNSPEIPGAIILAFDSPLLLSGSYDHTNVSPSHGAVALLLTSSRLPDLLASLPKSSSNSVDENGDPLPDYLRPHWDKPQSVTDNLLSLSKLPVSIREQLIDLSVLARLHKAHIGKYSGGGLALTRSFSNMIPQAQLNAALITPTTSDAADTQEKKDETKSVDCGWMVYNCGDEEKNAVILPSLLSALYHFEIDLSIKTSTNISTAIGNLGQANGAAMLGLAITRAAALEAPVLHAEFIDEEVAMSFVVPVPEAT